jgi:hypothetical protein
MPRWSEGGLWPTPSQEQLLGAALLDGEAALASWRDWCRSPSSQARDAGSLRLLPLVYRNLRRLGVAVAELREPHEHYRRAWLHNQRILAVVQKIVRRLDQAGVPSVVLKGLSLSLSCYRDMGARPMSDADVLVPVARAREAIEALVDGGWLAARARPLQFHYHRSALFTRAGDPELDLHWYVFGPEHQDRSDDDLWARRVPLDLRGVAAAALSPADELLHALVHGILWNPLPPVRWVADAALLIRDRTRPIDWDVLLHSALWRRLALPAREGLQYLQRRFEVPVPARVRAELAACRPGAAQRLEYWWQQQPCPRLVLYPFRYRRVCRLAGSEPGLRGLARFVAYVLELDDARAARTALGSKLRDWLQLRARAG